MSFRLLSTSSVRITYVSDSFAVYPFLLRVFKKIICMRIIKKNIVAAFRSLVCNHVRNCGAQDNSDEDDCKCVHQDGLSLFEKFKCWMSGG